MTKKIVALAVTFLFLGMALETKFTVTKEMISQTEKLFDLEFSGAERDSMIDGLNDQYTNYKNIRAVELPNSVPMALTFNPLPNGFKIETDQKSFKLSKMADVIPPANLEGLAFFSVAELGWMLKNRKVSSEQLTRMFMDRLKKYGPKLESVITITEGLALKQARRADEEIAKGKYRGPLHGIPYGLKDLLSTIGYKTTWGSAAYKDQIIDEDATVVKKLEEAGAVLVAKLTLGELAWGDVWYGGKTRNPWNPERGSSGSSAGPASSVSAGLLPFAIGTETLGSIVSPSTACGVTGLRPTFGRVSRHGAMALSWSMDKIGPIARSAEDCAIVLNSIFGADGLDHAVVEAAFNYEPNVKIAGLKIGYLKNDFEKDSVHNVFNDSTFETLRKLGATLIPIELPIRATNDLTIILSAEAGAAFDDLTRSGRDSLLVRQIKNAWPNVFRASRFIPAVEYIQANRVRSLLIEDMGRLMKDVDIYIAPSFEGDNLLLTNLTGHPCVVLPNGFDQDGLPTSITFMGRLFDEGRLLGFARQYQEATDFHKQHPKGF